MKKLRTILILIAVLTALLAFAMIDNYNGMIKEQGTISSAKSAIDAVLKEKTELIPDLVTCLAKDTEDDGLIGELSDLSDKIVSAISIEDKETADEELRLALRRLSVIESEYPKLKFDTTYTEVIEKMEGCEAQLALARRDYNLAVQTYNNRINEFPGNLTAKMFRFKKAVYFEPEEDSASLLGKETEFQS